MRTCTVVPNTSTQCDSLIVAVSPSLAFPSCPTDAPCLAAPRLATEAFGRPDDRREAKAKAISHLAEQWACGVAERTRPQRVPLFDRFLFWSVSKFFQGQRHLWSKLLHRLFSKSVFNILQPFVSQAQFLGPESSPRFARR